MKEVNKFVSSGMTILIYSQYPNRVLRELYGSKFAEQEEWACKINGAKYYPVIADEVGLNRICGFILNAAILDGFSYRDQGVIDMIETRLSRRNARLFVYN